MVKLAGKLKEVIDAVGGRKYALTIFVLLLLFTFGLVCVFTNVPLASAAVYGTVIAGKSIGYLHHNVKQKREGGS